MKKLILIFPILIIFFFSCEKNSDMSGDNLKDIATKAKSAGFNVKYNDTLKIDKPDLNRVADPNLFGQQLKCGLDDDSAFIKELERISQSSGNNGTKCIVPDAQTAIKMAVAALEPIYGKEKIAGEKPYKAILNDSVWKVIGTLPPNMVGGVAEAEISKNTGKILRIIHGK
jgi:hypothetical protein